MGTYRSMYFDTQCLLPDRIKDLKKKYEFQCRRFEVKSTVNDWMNSGSWKPDEIERFEWALNSYGKDYKKIVEHVKTRSHKAVVNRYRLHVKDKSAYKTSKTLWTAEEKQKFVDAVREFGINCEKISEFMGSKSVK